MKTTTFRVYRDQWEELQRLAMEKKLSTGEGRADASLVLRELLDRVVVRRKAR